ncbi:MAG: sulfatase [Armatimonadota bacterium]|nr:sulfatase [Armatimonadota bacterium]
MPDRRPNLLLIVLDTARRDRFGCYGYGDSTTPHLDALAEESLVFEHMISTAPWTVPSHASLFTGLYPREHGADNPTPRIQTAAPTLASHLASHGYATLCVTNNALINRTTGLAEGFERVVTRPNLRATARLQRQVGYVLGTRDSGAEATNQAVMRLLPEIRQPFFLFLNYLECHWPYVPMRAFERRFAPRSHTWLRSLRTRLEFRKITHMEKVGALLARGDHDGVRLLARLYDAEVALVDDRVGRLLAWLRRTGRFDDTIVIVTSDHGDMLGEGGQAMHQGSLHEHLIHVPFIARVPGRRAARVDALAQTTDVFAGLCRLLDVPVPAHLEQRAFAADPLNGEGTREYAFAEWSHWGDAGLRSLQRRAPSYDFSQYPRGVEAAQDRRYKLVVAQDTGDERLYDVVADPDETTDLLSAKPAEAARLRGALLQWREAFPRAAGARAFTTDEEARVERHLRDLGYM